MCFTDIYNELVSTCYYGKRNLENGVKPLSK